MKAGETTVLGAITISPRAIATIASHAANQSYGVVGMAARNLVNGLVNAVAADPTHGVVVHAREDQIEIDLFIVVEYGTRIAVVAHSVADAVKYQVEKAIGIRVDSVDVHVQDLRISDTD
jgi:uncharacterized alkaline shock family protein YloU